MRVEFDSSQCRWLLTSGDAAAVLRLAQGQLHSDYFGDKSGAQRAFPDTFPDWPDHGQQVIRGRRDVSVCLGNSVSPVKWLLDSWEQLGPNVLRIRLQGKGVPLEADIEIEMDPVVDCYERRTTLRHSGIGSAEPLHITSATSFAISVPGVERLTSTSGWWGRETQVWHSGAGSSLLLESRSGKTGFENSPYLALEGSGRTTVVQLGWSGNWQMHVAPLLDGRTHISGGLNPWGLHHSLAQGCELRLPDAVIVNVRGDLNRATQSLHRWRRRRRLSRPQEIPVHFNTWYPFPGPAPYQDIARIVPLAAALGCETFVVDAGWYENEVPAPADRWLLRAGDWLTDEALYPKGLNELAALCRQAGMQFGLWFEPEAAGPTSQSRRNHPNWFHNVPDFPFPAEDLAVVNLGVPQAREWLRDRIIERLTETDARWMKWDFNANIWEGGWAEAEKPALGDLDPLIEHYRGLYQLQTEITAALPQLLLEMCSSGGGRFDFEIMRRAHTNWISDETQSLPNLSIHFGSQLMHPPEECTDWVVDWPPHAFREWHQLDEKTDLLFKAHVAMLGSLGISAPLQRWDEHDMNVMSGSVNWYKQRVRRLFQDGNQYLLTEQPPPDGSGDWAAIWYAAPDASGGSLTAFRLEGESSMEFSLQGLDPDALYEVTSSNGTVTRRRGEALEQGIPVSVDQRFRSVAVSVERC